MTPWMDWLGLPLLAAAVSIAALAALHRLRTRPNRRLVATTLFWQHAPRQAQPRLLFGKFSRVGSFLFLSIILLLLASSLSQTVWKQADSTVIVIDTGYTMGSAADANQTRAAAAVSLAEVDLHAIGDGVLAIITSGPTPVVIQRFDEPAALAQTRLETIPTRLSLTQPSNAASALRLANSLLPVSGGSIIWYTDHPAAADDLPASILDRVIKRPVGKTVANAAILDASFIPDYPSATLGTLIVRVGRWNGTAPKSVSMSDANQSAIAPVGNNGLARFHPVVADGSTSILKLVPDDAQPGDDELACRLPRRPPIRFRFSEPPDTVLLNLMKKIGTVTDDARLTIKLLHGSELHQAMPVNTPALPALDLEDAVCGPGADLSKLGGIPLMTSGQAVLASEDMHDPARPTLLLSDALFSQGSTLPSKPAFFLALLRGCRELAGWQDAPIIVPSGRRLTDPTWPAGAVLVSADRNSADLAVHASSTRLPGQKRGYLPNPWQIILVIGIVLLLADSLLWTKNRVV
jgi:hypothetical protein